jgi:hypothetical protein
MKVERQYCLVLGADGRWLVLARNYKPFGEGHTRTDWVDYETCPGIRLTLNDAQIRRASHGCQPYRSGDPMFWLYSDVTQPGRSRALLAAYRQRLAALGL